MTNTSQDHTLYKTYILFRFLLALILIALFYFDQNLSIRGNYESTQFFNIAIAYLTLTSIHFITHALGDQARSNQRSQFITIAIDISVVITMGYITEGVNSSLNTLLLIPIAAAAIFFSPIIATFFAATAAMALLAINIHAVVWLGTFKSSEFVTTGFLGSIFFITSLLVQFLTKRIKTNQSTVLEQQIEITALQRLNQHIVERLRTGIIVFNHKGRIALSNKTAVHLLGDNFKHNSYIAGELLTKFQQWQKQDKDYKSIPFQQSANLPEVTVNFLKNQSIQDSEEVIAFIEDNAELNQQAQQFKLAALGRLSASIAHEIRNPLSAIAHSAQLLQEDSNFDIAEQRLVEIINNNTQRVENIITNVLSISKRKQPNLNRVNIFNELKSITNHFQEALEEKGTIEITGKDSIETIFDSSHLSQIMTNLIENALRYSHENTGKYYVKLSITEDINQQPMIQVYDLGTGVNPQHIEQLFEPFFTTSKQGTGLGLFICRELCELNFAKLSYIHTEKEHFFQIRCTYAGKQIPDRE